MTTVEDTRDWDDWAIIYQRPDGWWSAGDHFEYEAEARQAAEGHDFRGAKWKIIKASSYADYLCEEAMEDVLEAEDSNE